MSDVVNGSKNENQSSGHDQLSHVHPEVVGVDVDLVLAHAIHLVHGQGEGGEEAETENVEE